MTTMAIEPAIKQSSVELCSCDAYIINLEKDIGRKICSKNISNIFNAKYWEGLDPNVTDKDGYVTSWKSSVIYTKAAKKAKLELFKHFLATSSSKYLAVFEDDIYIHKAMLDKEARDIIISKINNVLKFKDPAVIYLGISKNVSSKENDITKLFIEHVVKSLKDNKPKPCSGAYGFIVNRDVIPIIIARIKNMTFENDPFDLSCLSYILMSQPNRVYISHPPIVVPDISFSNIRDNMNQSIVWNSLNVKEDSYDIIHKGVMFVKITSGSDFDYFRKMITCITPYIKIIYVSPDDYSSSCKHDISSMIIQSEDKFNLLQNKYSFIIKTTTEFRIKYRSGHYLINLINEHCAHYGILELIDKNTKDIIMTITFVPNDKENNNNDKMSLFWDPLAN